MATLYEKYENSTHKEREVAMLAEQITEMQNKCSLWNRLWPSGKQDCVNAQVAFIHSASKFVHKYHDTNLGPVVMNTPTELNREL